MKITFESGSYSLRSLFCALLLAFASFSILPLSVALLPAEKKTKSELVRVYSQAENFPEKTANAAVPSASSRVAAPSGVRGEPRLRSMRLLSISPPWECSRRIFPQTRI